MLEDDVIDKAQELDRKFGELQASLGTWGKTLAVGFAQGIDDVLTDAQRLEQMFGSEGRARQVVGENVDDLAPGGIATGEAAEDLRAVASSFRELEQRAFFLRREVEFMARQLARAGENAAAQGFYDLRALLTELEGQLKDGSISGDDFAIALKDAADKAKDLVSEASAIDGIKTDNAVSAIGNLLGALTTAYNRAVQLRGALPAESEAPSGPAFEQGGRGSGPAPTSYAPGTSLRPQLPGVDASFGTPEPSGGGRSGGGGATSDYERATAVIRDRITALELEAAELLAVAAGGRKMGDAIEYSRRRAELLTAAMKDGREITPELRAEIDQLALAYTTAGENAATAADKLQAIEDQAERGADRMTDLFMGIASGSMKAKDAVIGLLLELAKVNLAKNLTGAAKGGGFFGSVISALGFSEGGYTGAGAKHDPAGIVHAGEFVVKASQVRKPGMRSMLESINSGASAIAPGAASSGGGAERVIVELNGSELVLTDGGTINARITATARQATQQGARMGAQQAVGVVKQSMPGWQQELGQRGTIT